MNQLIFYPILVPLLAALLAPLLGRHSADVQRGIALSALLGLVAVGAVLMNMTSEGAILAYRAGNWLPPFGIVLVVDRLAAMLVTMTSVVALLGMLYAMRGMDRKSPFFHTFYLLQVVGIQGAFMTGDVFNLFVFFEVLLLSSYNLLVYGGGTERIRTGIHYVALNLLGSGMYLFAVGTMYAMTGTLNMADMALRAAELEGGRATIFQAGTLMLMVVFSLKAALVPLYLWLPRVYSAALAPVAALFAVLTKVGVYAVLRLSTLLLGPEAGEHANLLLPYLLPLGLATLVMGMVGALGSTHLRAVTGYLIVASVGTMFAGIGLFTEQSIGATLYYMVHSTVSAAAMFLLVDLVARQRGEVGDALVEGPPLVQPATLGVMFFAAAIASAGLPPLSGFLGKALIIQAAIDAPRGAWAIGIMLAMSLVGLVAMSRAGTLVFWKTTAPVPEEPRERHGVELLPVLALLLCIGALTVWAGEMSEFTREAARQLVHPTEYIAAVLGRS